MFNTEYAKKLNDVRWKAKCIQIKKRDKGMCKNCGSTKYLNVHHRQYHFVLSLNQFKNPWDYPEDVFVNYKPSSAKLKYLFSSPTIMWSSNLMSSIFPASRIFWVISLSL